MRKLSLLAAAKRLLSADYIQFIMHIHPDADTFGSCCAAAVLCEAAGKRCDVVCADEIPEALESFGDRRTLSPSEGEAALEAEKGKALVCAVDVASARQFGEGAKNYIPKTGLLLDHHKYGAPAADNYVNVRAAAAGEIIFDIAGVFMRLGAISQIPKKALEFIYIAISSDTGSFRFSNTTARTHRIAAKIMEAGVNCADMEYRLHIAKPLRQIEAERIVYNRLQIHLNGKLAAAVIDNAARQDIPLEYFDTAVDIARSVKGVSVGCALKEAPGGSGEFRISLRSDGRADVAAVCARFGGGGHYAAAGCTVTAASAADALLLIIQAVEKQLQNG